MLHVNKFCCTVLLQRMAPILDIRVKMIPNRKNDVIFGILVADIVRKVYL